MHYLLDGPAPTHMYEANQHKIALNAYKDILKNIREFPSVLIRTFFMFCDLGACDPFLSFFGSRFNYKAPN